jgi:hypothetical protein
MQNPLTFNIIFNPPKTSVIDHLIIKVKGIGDAAKIVGEKIQSTFSTITTFGSTSALGINQIMQATQKLISFVSKPLEKAAKFETITTKLEVVLGSADKAQRRLEELSNFAKTTPFGLGGIVEMSNQLQTLGVYSKETMKTLTTLAAGSGKSIEQVTEAYIKMARGKKGIAVELFRDIGISIEDFVEATGKGIDKQTGQITASSKEMMKALTKITEDKGFAKMMEKQADTLEGQLKRVEMSIGSMVGTIGKILLPIAKNILDIVLPALDMLKSGLNFLARNINILITTVEYAGGAFVVWQVTMRTMSGVMLKELGTTITTKLIPAIRTQLIPAITTQLIPAIKTKLIPTLTTSLTTIKTGLIPALKTGLTGALKTAGTAFKAFGAALATNPIGILLLAIGGVIGLTKLWQQAQENKLKKEIEVANMQVESLKIEKEKTEVQKTEAENMKSLMDEYQQLASTEDKAVKNKDRLTKISKTLNDKYTDLNINTENFTGSLQAVADKAKVVTGEITKYGSELSELDKKMVETEKKFLAKKADLAKENVLKSLTEGGFFETMFVTKGRVDDDLHKQFHDMYHATTETELREAKAAMEKAVIGLNYLTADGIIEGKKAIEEFFKARMAYLGLAKDGVNEIKDLATEDDDKDKNKKAKTEMEKLEERLNNREAIFKREKALLDEKKLDEKEHNAILLKLEEDFVKDVNKIRLGAEQRLKKGEGKTEESKNEYYKANNLLINVIEKEKGIKKDRVDRDKKHWEDIVKNHKEGEELLRLQQKLGIANLEEYAKSLKNLLSDVSESELAILEERFRAGEKLTEDEMKTLQSYITLKEELLKGTLEAPLSVIEKGEQEIERRYKQGLINTQEYYNELQKLYADLEVSALNDIYEKWVSGAEMSNEEMKIVDSVIKQRESLFQKVSDVTVKAKNIEMAELSKALSLKDADFQNGKIKLEEYTKFVTENIEKLASELDKPEYKNIFDKLQEGELTDEWLNDAIEQLKKDGDQYAEALNPIIKTLEEFKIKKKELQDEITNEQKLYGDVVVSAMETISKGLGEAMASGFGEEGFKKLSENLFQGFKMILISTLEYIEKEYLLGTAKSILDAIFNPVEGGKNIGLLVGAGIAIQTAKAAINSWTPKFALGGGVTGPTYLLAGENNKKEYIISPEQMKQEVRDLMRNEMKQYYMTQNSIQKQVVEVKLQPVEFVQHGSDLVAVVKKVEKKNSVTEY